MIKNILLLIFLVVFFFQSALTTPFECPSIRKGKPAFLTSAVERYTFYGNINYLPGHRPRVAKLDIQCNYKYADSKVFTHSYSGRNRAPVLNKGVWSLNKR